MLTARGLFSCLPSKGSHAHIARVRSVFKSYVGSPNLNMDITGLRVIPLSLIGEAAIWFTKLPYNSIYTWNQLRDVFLARYHLVSKNLNKKIGLKTLWNYRENQSVVLGIGSPRSWEVSPITASMMSH